MIQISRFGDYIYIWLVCGIAMHQIMAVYFTCIKVINICTSKQ